MTQPVITRAEEIADQLRAFSAQVDALAWALDSELSSLNKDAAGYRARSKANPDGGANSVPGDLEIALVKAEAFLSTANIQAAGGRIEAFSVGGTYGRHYAPTLAGLDAARAQVKALQLAGYVAPLRTLYA